MPFIRLVTRIRILLPLLPHYSHIIINVIEKILRLNNIFIKSVQNIYNII